MSLAIAPVPAQNAQQDVGFVQKDAPITNVPLNVLRLIFEHLPPDSFKSALKACKRFWAAGNMSDGLILKMKILAQITPVFRRVGGDQPCGYYHDPCLKGEMLYLANKHGSLRTLNLRTSQAEVLIAEAWGDIAISGNKLLTGTFDDTGSKLPCVLTQLDLQTKTATHHIMPVDHRCSQDADLVFDRALGLTATCQGELINVVDSNGTLHHTLSLEENTAPDGPELVMMPAHAENPPRLIAKFFRSKQIDEEPGYIYGHGIKSFRLAEDTQETVRMFYGDEIDCVAAGSCYIAIATCSRNSRGPLNAQIHLLDPATLQTAKTFSLDFEERTPVKSLHFGDKFLAANIDKSDIIIYNLSTEQETCIIPRLGSAGGIELQGALLAFEQREGESHYIELRDLNKDLLVAKFLLPNEAKAIDKISFQTGENLIAIDQEGMIYIWHIKNIAQLKTADALQSSIPEADAD